MDINLGLNLNQTISNLKKLNNPTVYEKFIEYRIEYIRYNFSSSKWLMQILFSIAAFIEIFVNGLVTNEYIVDWFGAIAILFIIEVLFQLRNINFFARYSGHILILAIWIHFCEVAVSNEQLRIYPGMLAGIAMQFFCGTTLSVHADTSPYAMILGSVYTMIRYLIHGHEDSSVLVSAFVTPLPFMYVTCHLVYQHSKNEFLRYEYQKDLIKKFRKILKEFPEQILITQQSKNKIFIPFTNDELLIELMKASDLPGNGKIVQKRSDDSSDFNINSTVNDDTNRYDSVTLIDFLLDERKKAIEQKKLGRECNIIMNLGCAKNGLGNDNQLKEDEKPIKYYSVKTKHIRWIDDEYSTKDKRNLNLNSGVKNSFLHIFIDTTKTELLKTEQTLRKYQRLMLSSVAHEFRNPLNAIKGNLELMQYFNIKHFEKYLKTSRNSWLMLNSYVDDILDLGRIEGKAFHLNNTEFKLKLLCDEVIELFELELRFRKINFDIKIQKRLQDATITNDFDRLKQVMINLVSNAIKFCKSNIQIKWFTLQDVIMSSDRNSFNDVLTDQNLEYQAAINIIKKKRVDIYDKLFMSVTDDGIGISKDDQASLFKLFGKLKQSDGLNKKGWGLGLTVCKKIIEQMDGEIEVISDTGEGAIFWSMIKPVNIEYYIHDESNVEKSMEESMQVRFVSKIARMKSLADL